MSLLNQAAILIAEDEPYIALALQCAVEDVGGTVIGPAATRLEAISLLDGYHVDGAILDVNLADGDITPVVARLVALGVPLILQTGNELPGHLAARFPGLTVHIKPCVPEHLVELIGEMLRSQNSVSYDAAQSIVFDASIDPTSRTQISI